MLVGDNDTIRLGRGYNRIFVKKRLGIDYFEATVEELGDISEEQLTLSNEACNSDYKMWSPGGSRSPINFVPNGSYDGYPQDPWVYFEFFSPVCVTRLFVQPCETGHKYPICILYGSHNGLNWDILLDRSGEWGGAYGDLSVDVKGYYRFFKFNFECDSRWGYLQYLRLFGHYLDRPKQTVTMLNRISTITASGVQDGHNIDNITNDGGASLVYVLPDENGAKLIKWELDRPHRAFILRLDFQQWENYNRQVSWFKLEGSEDGKSWELLFERNSLETTHFKNYHSAYWNLFTEKSYKYYKLTCVRTNDASNDSWMVYGAKLYEIEDGIPGVTKIVPNMTSAEQDGFEVSASSVYADDHATYYAFDGDPETKWAAKSYDNQWIQIRLAGAAVANAIRMQVRISWPVQMPKNFAVLGSNDGENFDELLATEDAQAWASGETRVYAFENNTPYLYYRLKINSSFDGNSIAIANIDFGQYVREYKRDLYIFDYVIPILTGDETTVNGETYKLSSSSEHSSNKRYFLFDRNAGTPFETAGTPSGWVQIECSSAKTVNAFQVVARNDSWADAAPRTYSLLTSNDGNSWDTLASIASDTPFSYGEFREYELGEKKTYRFFRLEFDNGNRGNTLTFARWDLVMKEIIKEY